MSLTFELRGEKIVAVQPPVNGFCRRGIEGLVAGKPVDQALEIMERSCSFAAHSHRVALCQAIETATGAAPSARARLLRALFAEVERMLARLWTLGMSARAAGVHALFRDAMEQREALFERLTATTGERLFWALGEPSGVRAFEAADGMEPLRVALEALAPAVATWRVAAGRRGPLGRIGAGIGRITPEQATELKLSGLSGRASGVARDVRRDSPYGAYADGSFPWEPEGSDGAGDGDVAARVALAAADLGASHRFARTLLDALPDADDASLVEGRTTRSGAREGHSAVEGPHGAIEMHATVGENSVIASVRMQTPGAALFAALPTILEGQLVAHAPMILASLDLCIECLDL